MSTEPWFGLLCLAILHERHTYIGSPYIALLNCDNSAIERNLPRTACEVPEAAFCSCSLIPGQVVRLLVSSGLTYRCLMSDVSLLKGLDYSCWFLSGSYLLWGLAAESYMVFDMELNCWQRRSILSQRNIAELLHFPCILITFFPLPLLGGGLDERLSPLKISKSRFPKMYVQLDNSDN